MCSSQDSKYFLPPTPMGAGDFSVPLTYQSNKEPTTDVGNQAPIPDPNQFQPPQPPVPTIGSGPGAFPGRPYGGAPVWGGGPVGRSPFYGGMPMRGYPGLPTSPRFGGTPSYSGAPAVSSPSPILSKPTFSPMTSMPNSFNGFSSGFNRRMIFG